MRPEISNQLLLQVIQAWDPANASHWRLYKEELRHDRWFIRGFSGGVAGHSIKHEWFKPCELVEFLLKDRPDLGPDDNFPYLECKKSTNGYWYSDPWGDSASAECMVLRIKSYEYLKAWKESQGTLTAKNIADGFKRQREALHTLIDGISVDTFSLTSGQAIVGYSAPTEVPATYEKICPYCNGSKEVTDWHGKESCQACG